METRTWEEVLPGRLAWELEQMEAIAPDLTWDPVRSVWSGLTPVWPFDRPQPSGLDDFLDGDRFSLEVAPSPAHPAVPPSLWPIGPQTKVEHCTDTAWHTNGDGSLCVVREHYTWTGAEACAALIPTAAGWFLEFLLMTGRVIDAMTVHGIETSPELDDLFNAANRRPPE